MSTRTSIPAGYFSAVKPEYSDNSLKTAVENGTITKDDADLIGEFLIERRSSANLSSGRINKLTYTLVSWRRFIGQFREIGIVDVHRFYGVDNIDALLINQEACGLFPGLRLGVFE